MTTNTELLASFPEINPANYTDDDVNALNAWGIAAHSAIEALEAKVIEQDAVIEQRNAELSRGYADFTQAVTDPENQPSQWGTVTLAMYQALETQLATERRHNERATNHLQDQRDALQAQLAAAQEQSPLFKKALDALEVAQDNLRPHGDNCFLHDSGEYASCFCGKDSLSSYLQSVVEELAIAQDAAPIPQQSEPSVPEGWKLVPIEPTKEMICAPPNAWPADAKVTWAAMCAAAPQPKETK